MRVGRGFFLLPAEPSTARMASSRMTSARAMASKIAAAVRTMCAAKMVAAMRAMATRMVNAVTNWVMNEVTNRTMTSRMVHYGAMGMMAMGTTSIGDIDPWTGIVETRPVVVGIDGKQPRSCMPGHRTVEIGNADIAVVLPTVQHHPQLSVARVPPIAQHVVSPVDTQQIVEIDLIHSLVLLWRKVQFVGHLVAQEECLFPGCAIAHGVGSGGHDRHHCQNHQLLHLLISYTLVAYFCFHRQRSQLSAIRQRDYS